MSRVSKAIKMLVLLKSRGKLSRKELSSLLDETPRNILNIKADLEEAGYEFISTTGKYGGYELVTNQELPEIHFTNEDYDTIKALHGWLSKDTTILNHEKYAEVLDRLIGGYVGVNEDFYQVYNSVCLNRNRKELEHIYEQLQFAIDKEVCVEFTYEKTNGEMDKIRVEPYYLVSYRNAWYLNGVKNTNKRTYKLNRIKELCVLVDVPFKRDEEKYSFSEDTFDLEDIHVELMVFNRNDISEYKYCDSQEIKRIDSNTFYFSGDMKEYSAWALIKNLGKDCKIIEPDYLRERLIEEAKEIIGNYEGEEE